MKNFQARGEVLDAVLGADVLSGAVVKVGSLIGFALTDGKSGDTIAVKIEGAFNTVPKVTGTAWLQGDPLFWDASAAKFTKVAPGNTFAGYAYIAAGSSDATGMIVLESAGDNAASSLTAAAVVAALGTTANLSAIGATFSDLAAARTAVNTLATESEARLDAIEAKVDAILVSLKAAGLMASA